MPATEVAGSFSGFGDQISSRRATFPKHGMGTGGRTFRIMDKALEPVIRGRCAPAAQYNFPVCLFLFDVASLPVMCCGLGVREHWALPCLFAHC